MPFNHVCITAPESKFDDTIRFYLTALGPLGYAEIMRPVESVVGMGPNGVPEFWITAGDVDEGRTKVHIAFDTDSEWRRSLPVPCTIV